LVDSTTYYYDANGSQTYKIYASVAIDGDPETLSAGVNHDQYEYNLQNKLAKATTTKYIDGTPQTTVVEYKYNPAGIRIEKKETTSSTIIRTDYLIDPANHTGYAQVLQETQYDITTPASPVPLNRTDYVLGDDVLSQTKSTWSSSAWTTGQTQYLLYDGQGSTRQLVNTDLSVQESYSYDGYGVMLSSGSGAEAAANAATNLLYTGEQYDKNLSQYYLRARYYNPLNGLFNQMDPYAGNTSDPQSLHKYLYVHANPVNGIDPSGQFGEFSLGGLMTTVGIMASLTSIHNIGVLGYTSHSVGSEPERVRHLFQLTDGF
jgi:RHS repeat-associated protein